MNAKKITVFLLLFVSVFMGTGFALAAPAWPQPELRLYAMASDLIAPTGLVNINGGAANTNSAAVNLSLTAIDTSGSVSWMRFSNDGAGWTATETFSPAKPWTLPAGDGNKTVWAVFIDNADNTSTAVWDNILLDTVAPTASVRAPAKVKTADRRRRFKVFWESLDRDPSSGLGVYDVQVKVGSGRWKPWKTGVSVLRTRFTGTVGKTYYFRARAKDKAGNLGAWSRRRRTVVEAL